MKTLKSNLKSNLLGVFALIAAFGLVLGMSAFTTGEVKRDSYTFYYDGPVPASENDVKNVDNWKLDPGQEQCDDAPELACSIEVSADYVNESAPSGPELDDSIDLQTDVFSTSAFVTASADSQMIIHNRSL